MISLTAYIGRSIVDLAVRKRGKGDALYGLPSKPAGEERPYETPKGYARRVIPTENATAELFEGSRKDGLIFNIHGGGFTQGLTNSRRKMAITYSKAGDGLPVLCPDYRISPEVTHPGALYDVYDAWKLVTQLGHDPARTVITSDSAGGTLAFALVLYLRDKGEALPAAVFSMSPLLDFALNGASHGFNLYRDPLFGKPDNWLPKEPVERPKLYYQGDADPYDPYLSPIYGDLKGLPPMLLQTGTWEILLSDTVDFTAKAKAAGVDARASLYDGMPHIFQCMEGLMPESRRAWKEVRTFLKQYLPKEEE